MAALGPCNSLTPSTTVTINELTTAAAQWALAQFFDSTGHTIGAPSSNATGLQNAYYGVANLADVNAGNFSVSGNASSFLPSVAACNAASPPANCDGLQRLNTLANILAGCVESSGASSIACARLMCYATPGLTYSPDIGCSATPAPNETMGAAYLIVTNPANNVSALYGLAAVSAPFGPTLAVAPDGWEMALTFAPAGAAFGAPSSIALDGSGNVFVANEGSEISPGSVSELTAASGYATGLNFAPAAAAFDVPSSIALDGSGNVFVGNYYGNSVSELTEASSYATGLSLAPAAAVFNAPQSVALDGSANVFVTNFYGNSVSELTEASSYATGLNFAPSGAGFSNPNSIALDGSGNVLVANEGNSLSELTAAGGYGTGLNFAPSDAAFDYPISIALDGSGNVFVASENNNSVSELTAASGYATGLNYNNSNTGSPGALFGSPISIAVDRSGNVFVANCGNESVAGSVSELTAASGYSTGLNLAPAGAAFESPLWVALDGSGNVWVTNSLGNSVSEVLGLAAPVVTPLQAALPPAPTPGVVTSTNADTSSNGNTSVTGNLPDQVQAGEFLLAAVAIESEDSTQCTAAATPFACCTGAGIGTCPLASAATIIAPSNTQCVAANSPNSCCTGAGTGTCDWSLVDSGTCGGLQTAVYGKFVQAGETGTTQYTWNFQASGNPASYLGSAGITLFASVGATPVENFAHSCTTAATNLSAPSITTTQNNTLNTLFWSITNDNSVTKPAGYQRAYEHNIPGTGPDVANDAALIAPSGTNTGVQSSTAAVAGDSLGFQLNLAPLTP